MSLTTSAVAVAACLLRAAAACTPDRDEPRVFTADDAVGAEALRCEESDLNQPSGGQEAADGVVLARTYTAEEHDREDGQMFAKGGLWVRGGTSARLTVTEPSTTLVSWGKPGTPSRQVVVPLCEGPEWRVWPGGFYVDGPSTVDLSVATTQKKVTVTVTVAIG